ncbi:MAG: methyltransferase domain-containing protein [Caldilineales bacterium]|nr:methyltransferase domain-containing protein [Caldilineales bacterium]
MAKQLSGPSMVVGQWLLAPLWNRRNMALNNVALERLALQADDQVLEVGFGGGYLLGQMLSSVSSGLVAGIDASRAMIVYCEKRYQRFQQSGRLELHYASVQAIPYGSAYFTKVCSVNSIFYWPDVAQGIGECGRVLGEGGVLVLCFTSKASLGRRAFARHGLHLYDGDEVGEMMKRAGLGDITIEARADRHRTFWSVVGKKGGKG